MNTLNNHNGAVGNGRADEATGRGTTQRSMAQFARVRNYWLGGKDNSAMDQAVGNEIASILPSIHAQARAGQLFLNRVVRHLAAEHHIRQFIDIGVVFPSGDSTHEVAQRVAPDCKIVYVDHDPVLLAHARALLTSHPDGRCDYVDADPREPDKILAAAGQSLDLDEPMALLLGGVLHHLPDDDEAASVVARLVDALAPGSFVGISHLTNVVHGAASDKAWQYWNQRGTPQVVLRSPEQLAGLLHGLDLTKPGVVSCSRWRPEAIPWGLPAEVDEFCGLARKPDSSRVSAGRPNLHKNTKEEQSTQTQARRRRLTNINVLLGSAGRTPFAREFFDAVLASLVVHLIPSEVGQQPCQRTNFAAGAPPGPAASPTA